MKKELGYGVDIDKQPISCVSVSRIRRVGFYTLLHRPGEQPDLFNPVA